MDTALTLYKNFIDDLVDLQQRGDVVAKRVREKHLWPETAAPELVKQNKIIESLSEDDRETMVKMLQAARDGGIHDTLVCLNEQITLNEMRLVINGTELPVEPFGTEMFYDWVARCEGDAWPDEK